jgi:acyl transferase domain-containing protein
VRETVRFGNGVKWLERQGVRNFFELGPDGVLSGMVGDSAAAGEKEPVDASLMAVPAMRDGRSEFHTLRTALAQMWVRGVDVDWAASFEGIGARRVELPTYAFQRERYWLEAGPPSVAGCGYHLRAGGRLSVHRTPVPAGSTVAE